MEGIRTMLPLRRYLAKLLTKDKGPVLRRRRRRVAPLRFERLEDKQLLAVDLAVTAFTADGNDLVVTYDVASENAQPFDVAIFKSYDGVTAGPQIAWARIDDSSALSVGGHQKSIQPSFEDSAEDYWLMVRVDAAQENSESNEANNEAILSSGVFITAFGTVHVHGTSDSDFVGYATNGDFIDVSLNGATQQFSLYSVFSVHVRSHDGADSVTADWGLYRSSLVFAGDGDDYVYGGPSNDYLDGGPGSDSVIGNDGDDVLFGGDGDDYLSGDGGNDSIYGDAGGDTLYGGNGFDFLYGGQGDDTLYGDDGDDFLWGDDGQDVLHGGYGHDWLDAGWGSEGDSLYGEDGNDTLTGSAGPDILSGGNGNDYVYGSDGDDTLYGDAGDDWLSGDDGDDSLYGGAGDDSLWGQNGDDYIAGDAGADALYGGYGADMLVGGAEVDAILAAGVEAGDFVYDRPTIVDFTVTAEDGEYIFTGRVVDDVDPSGLLVYFGGIIPAGNTAVVQPDDTFRFVIVLPYTSAWATAQVTDAEILTSETALLWV